VQPPVAAPAIAQSPANASAVAGGAVAFSVQVNDSSGAAYQWLRNGAEIAGATASSLTYAPVSLLESGALFSVRVSNAEGSVTSQAATLTVTSPALTLIAGSLSQQGPVVFPIPAEIDGVGSSATFENPYQVPSAVDDAGNLYIASMSYIASASPGPVARSAIRKVAVDGTVTTFAGVKGESASVDGVGSSARFVNILALSFDRTRKLLLVIDDNHDADLTYRIREVTLNAAVTTRQAFAARSPRFNAGGLVRVAWLPDGTACIVGGSGTLALPGFSPGPMFTAVFKLAPGGTPVLFAGDPQVPGYDDGVGPSARFSGPGWIAADAAGNLYVSDVYRLRRISPDGTVNTIAGNRQWSPTAVDGQGAEARFRTVSSLVVENTGNVLLLDGEFVRRVTPDGRVTTIATLPSGVHDLAIGETGILYAIGPSWVGRFDPFPA